MSVSESGSLLWSSRRAANRKVMEAGTSAWYRKRGGEHGEKG